MTQAAAPVYDRIGVGYRARRRPEPAWQRQIERALGDASTLLNVGAGTGSYEPVGRSVVAVEPSLTMIAQRSSGAAPVVRAVGEHLPFADRSFDVGLAVLTLHHWTDAAGGLAELARVTDRQIIVTWDPAVTSTFWLIDDYIPEMGEWETHLATLDTVTAHLPVERIEPMPVPATCTDGVMAAYWRRPEAYLDAGVRAAISNLSLIDQGAVARGLAQLRRDIADGTWQARYADLLARDELDLGYRLVLAGPG